MDGTRPRPGGRQGGLGPPAGSRATWGEDLPRVQLCLPARENICGPARMDPPGKGRVLLDFIPNPE